MSREPFERPPAEWSDVELDVGIAVATRRRDRLEELIHALGIERAGRRELARAIDDATTTATAEIIEDEC